MKKKYFEKFKKSKTYFSKIQKTFDISFPFKNIYKKKIPVYFFILISKRRSYPNLDEFRQRVFIFFNNFITQMIKIFKSQMFNVDFYVFIFSFVMQLQKQKLLTTTEASYRSGKKYIKKKKKTFNVHKTICCFNLTAETHQGEINDFWPSVTT